MMLYHGTDATLLPKIMEMGIAPRSKTKGKDNWKHTVTSNRKAVYLTDAYAWHFAAHASDEKVGMILEIPRAYLLPWFLCPDEDWMEQSSRGQDPDEDSPHMAPTKWSMKKRTLHYRKLAEFNPKLADHSLAAMGTAGYYKTIPWTAVTRYVTIDWKKLHPALHIQAVDSMVAMLNYRILSDRHKAFTKWFFGDPVTAAQVSGNEHWLEGLDKNIPANDKTIKQFLRQNEVWEEAMKKRDGLNVVVLDHKHKAFA